MPYKQHNKLLRRGVCVTVLKPVISVRDCILWTKLLSGQLAWPCKTFLCWKVESTFEGIIAFKQGQFRTEGHYKIRILFILNLVLHAMHGWLAWWDMRPWGLVQNYIDVFKPEIVRMTDYSSKENKIGCSSRGKCPFSSQDVLRCSNKTRLGR